MEKQEQLLHTANAPPAEFQGPNPPPTYNQSVYPPLPTTNAPVGMAPGPQIQHIQVVQAAPPRFGPESSPAVCPSCHQSITTRVDSANTTKTHMIALTMFLCGCCLCSCLPYCMDTCKSTNHYCPNCDAFLGTYER